MSVMRTFDAEFAVSIIQTLRRVAALISQAQTRFHDVTPTGGVWALLSGVGFTSICCYGQRWQGKLCIGRNLKPVQQIARKVLPKHVSLLYIIYYNDITEKAIHHRCNYLLMFMDPCIVI
jgi:hypothetical protein